MRLFFRYGPEGIEVTGSEQIEKVAPPSDGVEPASVTGIFIEVRDAEGGVLHRRMANNAIRRSAEIHNDDGSMEQVPHPETSGTFEIVVPDNAAADHVVVLASDDRLPPVVADAAKSRLRELRRSLRADHLTDVAPEDDDPPHGGARPVAVARMPALGKGNGNG